MVTNTTYEIDATPIEIPALVMNRPERNGTHLVIAAMGKREGDQTPGTMVGSAIVEVRNQRIFVWSVDHTENTEGDERPPWALLHGGLRYVPWFVMDKSGPAVPWTPAGAEYTGLDAEEVDAVAAWIVERERVLARYGLA